MEQSDNNTPNPQPQQYYMTPGEPGPLYMEPQNSVFAIVSLVSGIGGFFVLPMLGQILGVIFGHLALNEIKNSNGRLKGRELAIAGLIISYIGVGLLALVILVVIIIAIAGLPSGLH